MHILSAINVAQGLWRCKVSAVIRWGCLETDRQTRVPIMTDFQIFRYLVG